jgi:hypothetical protein
MSYMIEGKEYKYQCLECIQECDKSREDGCFTNDREDKTIFSCREMASIRPPRWDIRWHGIKPNFKEEV